MFFGPLVALTAPPQWPFCLLKCNSQTATASPAHCMSQWQMSWWRQKTWCLFTLSTGSYSQRENEFLPLTTSAWPLCSDMSLVLHEPSRALFLKKLMSSLPGVTGIHVPVRRKVSCSLTNNNFSLSLVSLTVSPQLRLSDFHLTYPFILNPFNFTFLLSWISSCWGLPDFL